MFLQGVLYSPVEPHIWYEEILPYIAKCTFIVASTTDVTYCGNIFGSVALPNMYNACTKVELPKFYWFSGVCLSRPHNPYLEMCRNLPNLQELTLAMHSAGLTKQRWAERQITELERNNPEAAKERIKLSVREAVQSYELDALFACDSLRRLRIEYVESEMTAYFCKVGDPMDVLRDLKTYLEQGFVRQAMQVVVELVQISEKA